MSERSEQERVPGTPADVTERSEEDGTRRVAPAAQAASRARRIGGRPQPRTAVAADTAQPAVSATTQRVETEDATDAQAETDARTEPDGATAPAEVEPSKPRRRAMSAARAAAAARADKPAAADEADGAAKDATDGEAAADEPGRRRLDWRSQRPVLLRWAPAALAGVVAVALAVVCVVTSHGVWWATSSTNVISERGQVLAAAKSCMATMNTYDYRKLPQSEAAGLACTTGKLTSQYQTAINTVIKPQAVKVQFTQTAQVNNAGVESVSPDGKQWVVLVFGQLATTNSSTGSTTPRPDVFSARATMQKVGSKWLVAAYQYAPSS